MGTRHLTMIISDKETKIAQYGSHDGYIEGAGKDILEFLKTNDLNKLKNNLKFCKFISNEEYKKESNLDVKFPAIEETNAKNILNMITNDLNKNLNSNNELILMNSKGFAADSLSCEWVYIIDFDNNTFEVFKGFNKNPLIKEERFYYFQKDKEKMERFKKSGYYPCSFVNSFNLNNLPDFEIFLEECKKENKLSEMLNEKKKILKNILNNVSKNTQPKEEYSKIKIDNEINFGF